MLRKLGGHRRDTTMARHQPPPGLPDHFPGISHKGAKLTAP